MIGREGELERGVSRARARRRQEGGEEEKWKREKEI
jgi:hypothetical protein